MVHYQIVSEDHPREGSRRQRRVLADGHVLTREVDASGQATFVLSAFPYAWVRFPASVAYVRKDRSARAYARLMHQVHGR